MLSSFKRRFLPARPASLRNSSAGRRSVVPLKPSGSPVSSIMGIGSRSGKSSSDPARAASSKVSSFVAGTSGGSTRRITVWRIAG